MIHTHREGSHGVQGVGVDLRGYEGQDEIGDSKINSNFGQYLRAKNDMVVRADIERS